MTFSLDLHVLPLVVIGVTIAFIVLVVMSAIWIRLSKIEANQTRLMEALGIQTIEDEKEAAEQGGAYPRVHA